MIATAGIEDVIACAVVMSLCAIAVIIMLLKEIK